MSAEEKRETDEKKREGSRKGQQYVSNASGAKQARRSSQGPPISDYDELSVEEIEQKLKELSGDEID